MFVGWFFFCFGDDAVTANGTQPLPRTRLIWHCLSRSPISPISPISPVTAPSSPPPPLPPSGAGARTTQLPPDLHRDPGHRTELAAGPDRRRLRRLRRRHLRPLVGADGHVRRRHVRRHAVRLRPRRRALDPQRDRHHPGQSRRSGAHPSFPSFLVHFGTDDIKVYVASACGIPQLSARSRWSKICAVSARPSPLNARLAARDA